MTQGAYSLLGHLPAVFSQDGDSRIRMGDFLAAFEEVIFELDNSINAISECFDPQSTPTGFLEWLAGWVALSLRGDWNENERRNFVQHALELYKWRGTRQGVILALKVFTDNTATIREFEDKPHYFEVWINLGVDDIASEAYLRRQRIAKALIDREKPAHTYYDLYTNIRTMQVGLRSTVGHDTYLGLIA